MQKQDITVVVGRLEPNAACLQLNLRFHTVRYQSSLLIQGGKVEIETGKISQNFEFVIRNSVLMLTATLDGQLLLSGQPIQAIFDYPQLRRGEGEAVITSHVRSWHPVSQDQLLIGTRIGRVAELMPPLAHALRDFRIGILLPPEDGAMFLWRSIESVLWFLADEADGKIISWDIDSAAKKLNIDPSLIKDVKKSVNHQRRSARHATRIYRDRLQWLEKIYGQPAPPFFSQQIASNDDKTVDIFPISFSNSEWATMCNSTRHVLIEFVRYLKPHVVGHLIVPPW